MKKIYGLFLGLAFCTISFAQPDQWAVAIDPAEEQTLRDAKDSILMTRVRKAETITVDGVIDEQWSKVPKSTYSTFIKYSTAYENGAYTKKSMLDDGSNQRRVSSGPEDFSGTYGFLFDDDYFYILFDIVDDEVNDGLLNPGTTETLELQEAPYVYEAQDLLKGAPYPPYTGAGHTGSEGALLRNQKYCYWGYLGAFQIVFNLNGTGGCDASIRQKADALAKVNYEQRQSACLCAWKPRTDGKNGYIAEVGISFKITLADSANNPYKLPVLDTDIERIAFEMKVIDRDLGKKDCQASWKAEDNNVWDAMLWCSKLLMVGWPVDNDVVEAKAIEFGPNPATDVVTFNEVVKSIEIISINGVVVKAAQNTAQVSVSDLAAGLYIVKTDGVVAGKMIKQ